jgi:hypothetical protein
MLAVWMDNAQKLSIWTMWTLKDCPMLWVGEHTARREKENHVQPNQRAFGCSHQSNLHLL